MNDKAKLQALREALKRMKLAGYVQPLHDEYLSEYPPACNRRLEWLCGFTGSAGTVAVLSDKAAFFTDGRYTLQAQTEIDGALFSRFNSADKTPASWISEQFREGRIGYDPKLFTRDMLKRMESALAKTKIELTPVENPLDVLWQDRPAPPASKLFVHEAKYHGEPSSSKRARIGEAVAKAGADAAVIVAPDSVCWLLNIRARDVEHTPLLLAPLIIDSDGTVELFVAPERVSAEVTAHLGNGVAVASPEMLAETLAQLGKAKKKVLCDPAATPIWFVQQLQGAELVEAQDPCVLPKAMKNPTELASIRSAHIRDGAAIAKLLYWLEVETEKRSVTEMEVGDRLLALRRQVEGFVEPSFNTIAGSGAHGAIVHYRSTEKTNRALNAGELFLLDSGGQYPDGTTDITRTVAIGEPSSEHKDRFTRVLKGHIAIAKAQFPEGTCGSQLDALARQYLWQAGLDYDHGTGHGVGLFLSVHEGPQRIGKRGGDVALKPGMVISNEPGYYKTGEYGIRLENLVAVKPCVSPHAEKPWLCFETLSCAPIDTRLVEVSLLTGDERAWLNAYHVWVLERLLPALSPEEGRWLKDICRPL